MMGCLGRLVVGLALAIQAVTAGLGLLVLGSAGVLGDAAIIASSDALTLFVLLTLSGLATIVLAVKIWTAGRTRRQLVHELSLARQGPTHPSHQDPPVSTS